MRNREGFTLIELLVVIAIIALLMSILMPSLVRVRQNAKATICIMNLKTWCTLVGIYTNDNNGNFHGAHGGETAWQNAYRRDYEDQPKIRCCPSAVKPGSEGGKQPFAAWGVFQEGDFAVTGYGFHVGDYGSYGENGYVQYTDPADINAEYFRHGCYWKTPYTKGAGNAPMFMGCNWMGGFVNASIVGQSEQVPTAPAYSGTWSSGMIDRYFMDRHNGYVGSNFCDFSARKVGMKELFRVKWHRQYDINKWYEIEEDRPWPPWMRNYKDY